jgi:hypothetical protein
MILKCITVGFPSSFRALSRKSAGGKRGFKLFQDFLFRSILAYCWKPTEFSVPTTLTLLVLKI